MNDKGKIIAGLVIFVAVLAVPFWFNAALGGSGVMPPLAKVSGAGLTECVLPASEMRERHMDLLNTWRDDYVRGGQLFVTNADGNKRLWPDGKPMMKSLSNTCLRCHADHGQFCERCHTFAGVDPYCWDCHATTKGTK